MIRTEVFGGARPKVAAHLLEPYQAAHTRNCWNTGGALRPIPVLRDQSVDVAFATKSIYRYGSSQWFTWNTDVDVVAAPVVDDTVRRVYWTGDGAPKLATTVILGSFVSPGTPTGVRNLGIPKPVSAPTVVASDISDVDPDASAEYHAWVYTYVSDLREEGPPSDPSPIQQREFSTGGEIREVTVTTAAAPTGPYGITHKRLYRTNTGESGVTTYQLVAEIPVAMTDYVDRTLGSRLGEGLESTSWLPPPPNLSGLIEVPGGVLAGFVGRDVYFCEPFAGHAWPPEYVVTVGDDVVGLATFGTSVVVCTKGRPYVIAGTHPSAYAVAESELAQACVAKRSIAKIGRQGVVYASPDGLVLVGPSGSRFITDEAYDLNAWSALSPENIIAAYHDRRYVAFVRNKAIAFDVDTQDVYEFDDVVAGVFVDDQADALFVIATVAGQAGIYEWSSVVRDSDSIRTATWRSKTFRGALRSPTAVQILGGEVSAMTLHHDGASTDLTHLPSGGTPIRIPLIDLAREWSFELETDEIVTAVHVGEVDEMY